jgi:hypothetical protein
LVVGETHISTTQQKFVQVHQNIFCTVAQKSFTLAGMKKDDQYYAQVLSFARESLGSYKAVAKAMGAPSGPAVEAWSRNGVAYKWRPELDRKFGAAFRKSLNGLLV